MTRYDVYKLNDLTSKRYGVKIADIYLRTFDELNEAVKFIEKCCENGKDSPYYYAIYPRWVL